MRLGIYRPYGHCYLGYEWLLIIDALRNSRCDKRTEWCGLQDYSVQYGVQQQYIY